MATQTEKTSKTTLAGWKKAKRHAVTLPSGVQVQVEIPNLPALIKTGQIPNDLVDLTIKAAQGDLIVSKELIEQQADFTSKLVALTVKEPEITEDDVADLPYEDCELIVEVATRQRDLDAEGHHIGGLEKSADFRKFRGLDFGDAPLESL